MYVLLSNRYATLKELRDDYSFEEAIDLYEVCLVNLHNRAIGLKNNNKSIRRRRR